MPGTPSIAASRAMTPTKSLQMATYARRLQLMGEEDPLLDPHRRRPDGALSALRARLRGQDRPGEHRQGRRRDPTPAGSAARPTVPLRFGYAGNFYANRSIWEGACTRFGRRCGPSNSPPGQETAALTSPRAAGGSRRPPPGSASRTTDAERREGSLRSRLPAGDGLPDLPRSTGDRARSVAELGRAVRRPPTRMRVRSCRKGRGTWPKIGRSCASGPDRARTERFFAMKSYERGRSPGKVGPDADGETFIFLKHTPDAPMPDCPSSASLTTGSRRSRTGGGRGPPDNAAAEAARREVRAS